MREDITARNQEQLFIRWVELYRKPVRGYLLSLTRDVNLAEDLSQETFCKAWANRERYMERGTPQAYLFRIADNLLVDYYRKRREGCHDDTAWDFFEPVETENPAERAETNENIVQLRRMMHDLSPIQARVLSLRFFSQLKFTEIADIVEIPLNTVLSHVHRGLKILRVKMGAKEADDE